MTTNGPSGLAAGPGGPAVGRPPLPMLYAITLTGILANTLIAPAIPDIIDDFAVGDAQAGLIVTAASVPGIVVAPLIGFLADRLGRRAVLIPCLVVFGLSGGLASFAPSYGALLALRFLQGFGSAGLINLAVVLIGDHWDGVDRARMIGRNAAVLTVGLAVLPLVGGGLTEWFGWRASFAPYWIALATAIAAARVLPRTPRRDARVAEQFRAALPALRSGPVVATFGTAFVAFVLIFGLILTALPVYLRDNFGIGAGSRGLVLALPALTSTVGALALGRIRRRWRPRAVGSAAVALFVVAFVVIAAADALSVLVVGALLYGLGEGLLIPTLQDRASELAPPDSRGAVVAVWVGAARAGQSVGPVAAGAVTGAFGSGATFAAGAALAGALLVAQVAGVNGD